MNWMRNTYIIFHLFLLLFLPEYNLTAQSDTVYIDHDPVTIEQTVYYVKPKDTINTSNELRLLSSLDFKQELLYNDGEFNNIAVEKPLQLVNELELGLFRKKKVTYFGIGIGVSQNQFLFNQEAFSITTEDSIKTTTTEFTIIDTFVLNTSTTEPFDSIFIKDTITTITESWEVTESEEELSSSSNVKIRYAFVPIYFGMHIDKGKFSFNALGFLKSYFMISKTDDINLISKGAFESSAKNDWLKTMYWQYGVDFSTSYKLIKNINVIANIRLNGLKKPSLAVNTDKKYLKLNLGLGTSFVF